MTTLMHENDRSHTGAEQSASLSLELHHRRMDQLLDRVEIALDLPSWSEARSLFARFRAELDEHIRIEEQVMFPTFEAFVRLTGGPTAIMRREHAEIARCLDDIEDRLASERTADDAIEQLAAMLASHNAKEECVLYPMFERHAPDEAYSTLTRELRSLSDS